MRDLVPGSTAFNLSPRRSDRRIVPTDAAAEGLSGRSRCREQLVLPSRAGRLRPARALEAPGSWCWIPRDLRDLDHAGYGPPRPRRRLEPPALTHRLPEGSPARRRSREHSRGPWSAVRAPLTEGLVRRSHISYLAPDAGRLDARGRSSLIFRPRINDDCAQGRRAQAAPWSRCEQQG